MESLLGSSLAVFVGITVVLFGGASWMTGRALALTWKPLWLVIPYGLLLSLGARFLTFALFNGKLLSLSGYLLSTAVLVLVMFFAWRLYRVQQMLRQYPWLYKRRGLFAWREQETARL